MTANNKSTNGTPKCKRVSTGMCKSFYQIYISNPHFLMSRMNRQSYCSRSS